MTSSNVPSSPPPSSNEDSSSAGAESLTFPPRPCQCRCRQVAAETSNTSQSQLDGLVEEIRSRLTLERAELSASVRKKTSARDERVSARVSGSLGVAFLVLAFAVPIVMDSGRALRALRSRLGRWRRGSSSSSVPAPGTDAAARTVDAEGRQVTRSSVSSS